MRCQLCNFEFEAKAMVCHRGCPMGGHCNLICCPNCGYQAVDTSKSGLVKLLRRLGLSSGQTTDRPQQRRRRRAQDPTVPLTHIPVGREVEIHDMEDMLPDRLARLSRFGLVPGSKVKILQRRLSPVVGIGETELALSKEVMEQIWVRPE